MTIFQHLKQLFSPATTPAMCTELECPNCWGWQEYEDQVIKSTTTEKIDLKNIDQKKGWIVAYATRKLNGFRT